MSGTVQHVGKVHIMDHPLVAHKLTDVLGCAGKA